MYKNRLPSLLFLLCLMSGPVADAAGINSVPINRPSAPLHGVVYHLPKTQIKAKVTYTVYKKLVWVDRSKTQIKPGSSTEYIVTIEKPVELSFPLAADLNSSFEIPSSKLRGFTVATDAKFSLDENGLLNSVNSTLDDKTGEIIEALSATAANGAAIAAMAMAAGGSSDFVECFLVKEFSEERGPFDIPLGGVNTLFNLTDAITDLAIDHVIQAAGDDPKSITRKDISRVRLTVSAAKPKLLSSTDLLVAENDAFKKRNVFAKLPVVSLVLKKRNFNGIVYRVPGEADVNLDVDINANIYPLYRNKQMIAHGGYDAVLPMRSGLFLKKTDEVVMLKSGGLASYHHTVNSRGEKIAVTLKNSTENLKNGLKDLLPVFQNSATSTKK